MQYKLNKINLQSCLWLERIKDTDKLYLQNITNVNNQNELIIEMVR